MTYFLFTRVWTFDTTRRKKLLVRMHSEMNKTIHLIIYNTDRRYFCSTHDSHARFHED
jgi:hypothetical protein